MLGSNTNTSTPAEDFNGWVQGPDTRGSLDIIWSCVAVLITALWTVLHLNIPGKGDGLRQLFGRKFRWGCASILAPDFLTLVAASQWDAAKRSVAKMRQIKEVEKDNSRWCMEHAFYANSGGFLLKCPDAEAFPIDAETIHYLVSREYIKLPTITRDEVWDKSKADLFAKAATVVQSGWLIISSIGRKAAKLPISPMETFTLAFIVSTVMSYFFWWRKPQNVETPTIITSKHTISHIRDDAGLGDKLWERSPTEFVGLQDLKWKRRSIFDKPTKTTASDLADVEQNLGSVLMNSTSQMTIDRVDTAKTNASVSSSKGMPYRAATDVTLVLPRVAPPMPTRIQDDSILPAGLSPLVLLSVFIPSVAHSAIHLLGWNFQYPTYAEKQLWRTAAVVLNATGAIQSIAIRILAQSGYKGRYNLVIIWINNATGLDQSSCEEKRNIERSRSRLCSHFAVWDICLTFTTICLLLARFAIITEVIISFRSLPKSVYITVNWSDFLPHV